MTEDEVDAQAEKYLSDGVSIAKGMISSQLAPVLGENPERWLGAGIMVTWLMEQIREGDEGLDDLDEEEQARRIVLLLAVVMRGYLEHPLAIAALRRFEAANP